MPILVENVLDVYTLDAISSTLKDDSLFEDGKKTAGKSARRVKNNLQARPDALEVKGAAKMVEQSLNQHPIIRNAALPAKFAKIMFNRYNPGMTYGAHIDDAIINNTRTDLSFTLFLSDPESYEGGELTLQQHDGNDQIKLPAGSLYLYPSNTLHYVEPVRAGSRLAAVGWIQSRIRLEEQRSILFDLYTSLKQLEDKDENKAARLNLLKVQSNLIRLWAD